MTPRFPDWAIGLSMVPFTDLGKIKGRGGEGLAKKGVSFYLCGICVYPTYCTTKNITPSIRILVRQN